MPTAAALSAKPAEAKAKSPSLAPLASFDRASADAEANGDGSLAALPWFIQAKLSIGAPDDPLEHEADRVAERVMRMPEPQGQLRRKCTACEEDDKTLQTKRAATSGAPENKTHGVVQDVLRSPGQPLDSGARAFFEPRFGHDLSQVRVHSDHRAALSAEGVGALAYATGSHIAFGAGQYAPSTDSGKKLLAHELAHTIQQTGQGTSQKQKGDTISRRVVGVNCPANEFGAPPDPRGSLEDISDDAGDFSSEMAQNLAADAQDVRSGIPADKSRLQSYELHFGFPPAAAGGFLNRLTGMVRPRQEIALAEELSIVSRRFGFVDTLIGQGLSYNCPGDKTIQLIGVVPSTCGTDAAFSHVGNSLVVICPLFWSFDDDTVRSQILIHESFHITLGFHNKRGGIRDEATAGAGPGRNFDIAGCYEALVADGTGAEPHAPCPDAPPAPPPPIHPKLSVGAVDDPLEHEADRVADAVMRMPVTDDSSETEPMVRRACCAGCAEEEKVQRYAAPLPSYAQPSLGPVGKVLSEPGRPLSSEHRAFFEPRLGVDLDSVCVHDDSQAAKSADAIGARAYTVGNHVVFGGGADTATFAGRELVAHELVHVVQQGRIESPSATVYRQTKPPDAKPDDGTQTKPLDAKRDDDLHIVPAPPAGGTLVYHLPTHLTFTESADYNRYQLMLYVGEKGLTALAAIDTSVGKFTPSFGSMILGGAPEPLTDEQREYVGRVATAVHAGIVEIGATASEFFSDFQRRGVDTANALLDASKERIEKEQQRYGIERTKGFFWDTYSVSRNAETEDLISAAKTLLAKQERVARAKTTFEQRDEYGGSLPPGGEAPPASVASLQAASVELQSAYSDYNLQRQVEERKHPVLASYGLDPLAGSTAETLRALSSGEQEQLVGTLAEEIFKKLDNIEDVRDKINKDWQRIWKLPAIVAATKQLPDIAGYKNASGPYLETFVQLAEDRAQADEAFISTATTVLTVTFALLSAIPTGGLSVGVAAAVTAGDVALGVALSANALQAFMFQEAASGTDFDKAKSISQEEPSLFWLALDLVGALASAKAAYDAFHELAELYHVATVARAADRAQEATAALARLEEEGNRLKPGSGIGTQLRQSAEGLAASVEADVREIEQNIGKARPSSIPGYTDEIPLGSNQYWRKSGATWCRFSSPPRCLIPPADIPVEVGVGARGAAIEIRQIELAQYEKLPNGFKTLDAVSGGTVEFITEDGKLISEYSNVKGISIKSTEVTEAGALRALGKTYLNELYQFSGYTLLGTRVKSLSSRTLELLFEEGSTARINSQTIEALSQLKASAKSMRIQLDWYVFSSGRRIEGGAFLKQMKLPEFG